MTMPIGKLDGVKTWLAGLSSLQTWWGSADPVALKARMQYPGITAPDAVTYPALAMNFGRVAFRNYGSNQGGGNFQPTGIIQLVFFDKDPAATAAGFTTFCNSFFGVMEDMADNVDDCPFPLDEIYTDDVPVAHTTQAENHDGDDCWFGVIMVPWGTR